MRFRSLICTLAILACPRLLFAQAHECDRLEVNEFIVQAGPAPLNVCWDGKDADGAAVAPVNFAVTIGTTRSLVGMAKGATANGAGLFLYSATQPITVPKGITTINIEVGISDGIGGTVYTGIVSPLALKGRGPAPTRPVKPRVGP